MQHARRALLGLIGLLTTATGQALAVEGQAGTATGVQTFRVSGSVGVPDAILKGFPVRISTDSQGYYAVKVPLGWNGEVTPEKEGYAFDPPTRRYVKVGQDLADQDYVAKEIVYTISGSTVQPDVVLEGLQTPDGGQVLSDGKGNYSVKVPFRWSGTVSPVKEGYTFEPPQRNYDRVGEAMTQQDYSATRRPYGRRSSRVDLLQTTGMNAPSPRIRIVPTSKADPEVFTAVADDLEVLLHILRKNLARKPAAISGMFPDYGDLLGRDQERMEGLYVQGYGVFLFTEAVLVQSAPSEKKADEGPGGTTPADPVWEQARQEMGGQPAGGAAGSPYGYGPGAGYGGMGATAGALPAGGWEQQELIKELIRTFRHASNIRHLDPNETITLSVTGRTPLFIPTAMAMYGSMTGTETRGQPDVLQGLKETQFTLQAGKADIDQFARGQLTQDQFRQKVKVVTY